MRVVVLGAGRMGTQIAVDFALHDHETHLLVRDPAKARDDLARLYARSAELGVLDGADGPPDIGLFCEADSGLSADLVVECLPESLDLKSTLLHTFGVQSPHAILGTNTSSLSVGDIGQSCGFPDRILGIHYWYPPLLMPLVELVPGPETRPALTQTVWDLLESLGREPLLVERDVTGFVWNRLQFAVLREALWLVDHGVTTAADIDRVTMRGLARRWSSTGLFESVVHGGIHTWQAAANVIFPALASDTTAESLTARVEVERTDAHNDHDDLAHAPRSGNGADNRFSRSADYWNGLSSRWEPKDTDAQ